MLKKGSRFEKNLYFLLWNAGGDRPVAYCTEICYISSDVSLIFSKTIPRRKKCLKTKNVYFDEIYNFCLNDFAKFCVLAYKET